MPGGNLRYNARLMTIEIQHGIGDLRRGVAPRQRARLRRHVRQQHSKEYDIANLNDYLHTSRLVWCYKDVKGKSWQPVL